MATMENAEEVMQILDRFTRLKQKEIPKELDDYLQYVAKTGDTVFKWSSLKYLFREKLLSVMKHFYETTQRMDEIPQYPNVDPFNYESMKSSLLERLELFNAAPFTVQRLCELLIDPRKQYSRIDKFMRALEKNILVVSTVEPGRKRTESENGDSLDSSVVNGDLSLDVNVDIDMEEQALYGNGSVESVPVANETNGSAESKEKNGTDALSSERTKDDDYLPNPKKAKLDLDGEKNKDKEQEPEQQKKNESDSTESASAGDAESVATTKASTENATAEPKEKDVEKEKPAEEDKSEVATEKKPQAEKEEPKKEQSAVKTETNATAAEDQDKNAEKKDAEKPTEEAPPAEGAVAPKEGEDTEVDAAIKADSKEKVDEEKDAEAKAKPEQAESENKADNKDSEKVIEKQDIEKGEKENIAPAAAVAAQPKEIKDKEESAAAKDDEVTKEQGKEAETKGVEEAKEKEKEAKEITESKVEEAIIPAEPVKDKDQEHEEKEKKDSPKDEAGTAAVPAKQAVVEATAEITPKSAEAEAAVAAKPEAVAEAAKKEVVAVVPPKADASVVAEGKKPETGAIEEDDTLPDIGAAVEQQETAAAAAAPVPPTLALNDQPMEDVVHSTGVEEEEGEELPAAVDEVVMADSAGGATEMATDANEPAKDEPAGMEVDDTSQEAMDQ